MRSWFGFILGAIAGFAIGWAVFVAWNSLVDDSSAWLAIARDLVPVCMAIAGARIGARLADRGNPPARAYSWRTRVLGTLVLASYLATWVLGIPAAMTDHLQREDAVRAEGMPASVLRVAFAPLPGIVVLHVESHTHGRSAWSGWAFFIWFPGAVKDLGHVPHWIA